MKDWTKIALKYEGFPSVLYSNYAEGREPNGFDCSGFIQHVLLEAEIPIKLNGSLFRYAREFFDFFGVSVHLDKIKRGDLVFSTKDGVFPSHVGFYLGEEKVIHAQGKRDSRVVISDLERVFSKPIRPKIKDERVQIYSFNPIGFKRPSVVSEDGFQKIIDIDEL